MGDEDFEVSNVGGDDDDNKFDMTVGVLQEILLDENFEKE